MEDMEEEDATSATPFDFKIKRAIFFEAEATKHWVEAGGVEEEVYRRRMRRRRRMKFFTAARAFGATGSARSVPLEMPGCVNRRMCKQLQWVKV